MQTLLLLVIGYVIFGFNVATTRGAQRKDSGIVGCNAALIASTAILGVDWILRLLVTPELSIIVLTVDAAVVSFLDLTIFRPILSALS